MLLILSTEHFNSGSLLCLKMFSNSTHMTLFVIPGSLLRNPVGTIPLTKKSQTPIIHFLMEISDFSSRKTGTFCYFNYIGIQFYTCRNLLFFSVLSGIIKSQGDILKIQLQHIVQEIEKSITTPCKKGVN